METITANWELLEQTGFLWRESASVRALVCEPLEREGFANAFSTRLGGVSPMPHAALNLAGFDDDAAENIYENRRRFLRLFAGDWRLVTCWQTHSANVRVVRDREDAHSDTTRCDALTTAAPLILLGVKTADCVPVILGDARTGACAAVHAGWRGTLASITLRALERMSAEYGTRAEDVRAALGPAALQCCYEVGSPVIESFTEAFTNAAALFAPTREGRARVDLHLANREQLLAAGVRAERIHTLALCTICRADLFFSYRREKSKHGRVGRLLSVIGRQK